MRNYETIFGTVDLLVAGCFIVFVIGLGCFVVLVAMAIEARRQRKRYEEEELLDAVTHRHPSEGESE